jgi:Flp pilus assembly protein TadG
MHRLTRSNRKGQSIVETVVGIIFMIPIVLFLFDVGVLVLANTANDNLAKQAARAAASAVDPGTNQGTLVAAESAAQNIVNKFQTSGFIDKVQFSYFYYNGTGKAEGGGVGTPPAVAQADPGAGNVAVVIGMEARAPVPFPGFDTARVFWARAVEPVVSLPPT